VSVRTHIRLHYPPGMIPALPTGGAITETVTHFARENGWTRRQALDQITMWLLDGTLTQRPDGRFDVHRHHPRRRADPVPKPHPIGIRDGRWTNNDIEAQLAAAGLDGLVGTEIVPPGTPAGRTYHDPDLQAAADHIDDLLR
jgi:hypothetical protein